MVIIMKRTILILCQIKVLVKNKKSFEFFYIIGCCRRF